MSRLYTCSVILIGYFLSGVTSAAVYVGCYVDDAQRMYGYPDRSHGYVNQHMTIDTCTTYCFSHRYIYSGLQAGKNCFCGNEIPENSLYPKRSDGECDKRCYGDSSRVCGGNWRVSLYKDCSVLQNAFPHCSEIQCESLSNNRCTKCSDNLLFKLKIGHCKDKCSWDSRWCWPGSCSDEFASSCSCMPGFNTIKNSRAAKCQPMGKPQIDSCQITAFGVNRENAMSNVGSSECPSQKDFYGRFQVDYFKVILDAHFNITIDFEAYKRHTFVTEEQFGITDVTLRLMKVPVKGQEIPVKNKILKSDPQSMHPKSEMNEKLNISSSINLTNGDKLCLKIDIQGGGYLVSKRITSKTTNIHVSYDKTKTSKTLCYIYDKMSPTHCFESSSCRSEPMFVSSRLARTRKITISFEDWIDPYPVSGGPDLASGIEFYEISIYEVIYSSTLKRSRSVIGKPFKASSNVSRIEIDLPDKNPMLYAILLDVKDFAKNTRQARRFVLFDNSSYIQINNRKTFRPNSASRRSQYRWQVNHGKLCFNWTDRFYNNKYINNNPLRPIEPDDFNSIRGEYDQVSGILPIKGTNNVNGVTDFYYTLEKNHKVIVQSGKVRNFTSQSLCIGTELNDGDSYALYLQAKDIMNNTMNDSVTVNIDRTVPEIVDMWLVRNGDEQLFVHHTSDLSNIRLQFKAFDQHSGLREVKWAFGVYENRTSLIEKAVARTELDTTKNCSGDSSCYCPVIGNCSLTTYVADLTSLTTVNKHEGKHNRRYFFSVKVTNNAYLTSVEHVDILVDESPPEVGIVLEGPLGSPDIDYTSLNEITVHWHGFIDHESGIKLYRIALGTVCYRNLTKLKLGKYSTFVVDESIHNAIKMTFPAGGGKYVVTLVAFNNAMSASDVVCSDGITFDRTIPDVTSIRVKHAKTVESVGCENGQAWLIREDVSKTKLYKSDVCDRLCENKTNDIILHVLPDLAENTTESEAISSFRCASLNRYKNNFIYTPSDLFEISWRIAEDHSQLAVVSVGFGRDISSVEAPDIMDYNEVHHPLRYIQRHPGLIGEERVYLFIKVQNRAGLETKVWFGPIIADETPPICPLSLQPVVENFYVIIRWSKEMLYDNEQSQDIGNIMFRFVTEDEVITPFLEWNILSHGEQCGINYSCIKYPVSKLQPYDTLSGSLFYVQLHAYNYAGHFCVINSLPIKLPSIFPPRQGLVLDVNAGSQYPHGDIDVTINSTVYCFKWSGFDHHENVHIQTGLGTTRKTDNIVKFHNIPYNRTGPICEPFVNATYNTKYYVTVKATCSGGKTLVSSDGFTVLNKETLLSSINVFHGDNCNSNNVIESMSIAMFNDTEIYLQKELIPGLTYTLIANNGSDSNLEFNNANLYIKHSNVLDKKWIVSFIPLNTMKRISLKFSSKLNSSTTINISLHRCDSNKQMQTSTRLLCIHWIVDKHFIPFITHYETALCQGSFTGDSCKNRFIFTFAENKTEKCLNGIFKEGFYKAAVRPCFGKKCLSPVWSKGVIIEKSNDSVAIFDSIGTVQDTCINTTVIIRKYECTSSSDVSNAYAYRWAIFDNIDGGRVLSDWHVVVDPQQDSTIKDNVCVELPVYHHREVIICVQSFCTFGITRKSCSVLKIRSDPNTFDKNILYDLNLNDQVAKSMERFQHSRNIGKHLVELHNVEMDFAERNVTVGGLVIGKSVANIEWYLLSNRELPKGRCSLETSCLLARNTTSGFVNFKNPIFTVSGVFYLCAVIHQTDYTSSSICSDGFLIDETSPNVGTVSMESQNGYIIEGSEINVRWSGFHGKYNSKVLGYVSGISFYQYAVGTYPGLDDVIKFTNAGLAKSTTIRHLNLKPGQEYYATIRAYNHVNRFVTAHSDPVIYDNTPPTTGTVQVENGIQQFLTTDQIAIQWTHIKDDESGIKRFEVGIGSSNHSVDVFKFQEYVNYAEINGRGLFRDGQQYFIMLRVTNGAGLISYTVSNPFIVDNSPPEIGYVMDLRDSNLSPERDVDFQRETNSIKTGWYGFYDLQSHIINYQVSLGTHPGNDDVMEFTDVGLQTSKTWRLAFQYGITYFATVRACNGAGLCSSASSNGVIIDNSPPIPGIVVIGDPGRHSLYLSDRTVLHASWIGFEDPHSGIDHFEICVGTVASSCNVMERLNMSLSSSFIKSQLNMSAGVYMFVTVRACNKVNLCCERSSKSFIIDDTPPYIITKPFIVKNRQQYGNYSRLLISDPSFLKVIWRFQDDDSPIIRTTISMFSELDSHVPVQDISLTNENEHVLHLAQSDLLRLGDIYIVKITACNAASLCETALSSEILVDYTPPKLGGFMPPLTFEKRAGNDTAEFLLSLNWYGFSDVESGIKWYYVNVGNTYSGAELVENYRVTPNATSNQNEQHITIAYNSTIKLPDNLFLSVLAENNAGLDSSTAKVTTDVVMARHDQSRGHLLIQKHSCQPVYCNNDCTCASVGKRCKSGDKMVCINRKNVSFFLNVTMRTDDTLGHIIASSKCLRAKWSYIDKGSNISRFEYSFGIQGSNVGVGVFNVTIENPWHDVGKNTQSNYCLPAGRQLQHKMSYIAYVRAWMSVTEYSIFESKPILVDHTPPVIHKRSFVMDSVVLCKDDIDYILSSNSIYSCWNGMFSDDESGISNYMVSLGTAPSVGDVIDFTDVGQNTTYQWSNITFEKGVRYYASVRAINNIGLQTEATSDGFVVDDTIPVTGIVFNTKYHGDVIYQSMLDPVCFSWHGFEDEHSFIHSYMVAFVVNEQNQYNGDDVVFTNVGLSDSVVYSNTLNHGDKIRALVIAKDGAGHESSVATSLPLIVDTTPPVSFKCDKFENLESKVIKAEHLGKIMWSHTHQPDFYDILKITVRMQQSTKGIRAYLKINQMSVMLQFGKYADNSAFSEFTYLTRDNESSFISLEVHDLPINTDISVNLSKCSGITILHDTSNGIMVKQISPDTISVCVKALDIESDIKQISVGAGSTPGGFQIQYLRLIASHLHGTIRGDFTHEMQVFVQAEVLNHAGLRSKFTSPPLKIDHTPPLLTKISGFIDYTLTGNETMLILKSTWKAIEEESVLLYCEYCIGGSEMSCNIVSWSLTNTLSTFWSIPFKARHGSQIFGRIRCINTVQLSGYGNICPFVSSYLSPLTASSEVQFISDTYISPSTQNKSTATTLWWDEFGDLSGMANYSLLVEHHNSILIDWYDNGVKNFITFPDVNMGNKTYDVMVKGTNTGGKSSIVKRTLNVENVKPVTTGRTLIQKQFLNKDLSISWEYVFSPVGIIESYAVSVGSRSGCTDILMSVSTSNMSFKLQIPESVHTLYVVVVATAHAGNSVTYRENIKLI